MFYHVGIQPYGYLGVDAFFVINGYLVIRSVFRRIDRGEKLTYFGFLTQKIADFWPLILLAGIVCIAAGYVTMLPDDYENLAESVVASNCFANNILLAITTKNYWNVINNYKPSLHFWYIGVLMQSYFLLPILPVIVQKKADRKKICGIGFAVCTVISLGLYLSPRFSGTAKFYYAPFRFYEITLGAVVACFADRIKEIPLLKNESQRRTVVIGVGLCLAALFLLKDLPIGGRGRPLLVCVLAAIFAAMQEKTGDVVYPGILRSLAVFGRMSFSYYVWHQIMAAFFRYTVAEKFSPAQVMLYIFVLIVFGTLSYRMIETPLQSYAKTKRKKLLLMCIVCCILSCAGAYAIYSGGGVVRDIPELDIYKADAHKNMHAEYNERAIAYDRDFSDPNAVHILVIGDSFGSDFVNILIEAGITEKAEVSKIDISAPDDVMPNTERIKDADIIFAAFAETDFVALPEALQSAYEENKVYIIGNKNFGGSIGTIYSRRSRADYLESSVFLNEVYYSQNEELRERYDDHPIDMIGPLQNSDGSVRVFTDTGRFISQDAKHLTKAGAQYYARILDLSMLSDRLP